MEHNRTQKGMLGKIYSNNMEEWTDRPKQLFACLDKCGDSLHQVGPLYDNVQDAEDAVQGTPFFVQMVYKDGIVLNIC